MKKEIGDLMNEIDRSPTRFQRIIRYLPHKIDIFLFELFGGLKK